MRQGIFYYTGTGNSLFIARAVAQELGETEIISMVDYRKEKAEIDFKIVGLVFPVHAWGLPTPVINFVKELKTVTPEYVFAVAVNAGQVSATLVQLERILKKKGITLSSGFEIPMPSNYIPWGGPGPKAEQQRRFDAAKAKISRLAGYIKKQEQRPVEKGPLWQRIMFTFIYKISLPQFPKMDRSFWVDNKCNSCGICVKVCPAQNISMETGKPVWHHQCEQCFACLEWCPQVSVQYGKKTLMYERYHHPDIELKDVLKTK